MSVFSLSPLSPPPTTLHFAKSKGFSRLSLLFLPNPLSFFHEFHDSLLLLLKVINSFACLFFFSGDRVEFLILSLKSYLPILVPCFFSVQFLCHAFPPSLNSFLPVSSPAPFFSFSLFRSQSPIVDTVCPRL